MKASFRNVPVVVDENGLHLGSFRNLKELAYLVEGKSEIKMDKYAHGYLLYLLSPREELN